MSASSQSIYLDYLATTPTDPRVASVVLHFMCSAFGNASSADHMFGDEAAEAVHNARQEVADLLSTSARSVLFTSGATESLNLAIQGLANRARLNRRLRILASPVEHNAVLDTCAALARAGKADVTFLGVDAYARVDVEQVEVLARDADVVCVMAANNEVGTVYPLAALSTACRGSGALFLSDATQAVGKIPVVANESTILAFSAHKIYGPKGCGALILPREIAIEPLLYGGGQQHGLRSGTLNVPGIAGLGEAVRLRSLEMARDEEHIARLRDELQELLLGLIPALVVNGDTVHRLAGCLHVAVPGIPNDAVIARLRHQVAISTGSACSSGTIGPSHVLRAMALPEALANGALRISVGKFSTHSEIHQAADNIVFAVSKVREVMAT